jgi:hypothetical protein
MKKPPILIKYGSVGVTIYQGKSGGSALYSLVWREGRKRYRKAFRNLGKATDHAGLVAKRLESGYRTAAKLSNADAEAFGLAMKDLAPLHVPLNVAVKEFAQASKLLGGASIVEAARFYSERRPTQDATISTHDAVEQFLVAKASDGVGNRYLQDVRSRLRRFAKAFSLPLVQRHVRNHGSMASKGCCAPKNAKQFPPTHCYPLSMGSRPWLSCQGVRDGSGSSPHG